MVPLEVAFANQSMESDTCYRYPVGIHRQSLATSRNIDRVAWHMLPGCHGLSGKIAGNDGIL